MNISLLLIIAALLIGLAFIIYLLVSNGNKKRFISIDGTNFTNEESCLEYNALIEKLSPLYQDDLSSNKEILGLSVSFIKDMRNKGFNELKTLISYKQDLNDLVKLLNDN